MEQFAQPWVLGAGTFALVAGYAWSQHRRHARVRDGFRRAEERARVLHRQSLR